MSKVDCIFVSINLDPRLKEVATIIKKNPL